MSTLNVQNLDLTANPICEEANYRDKVFSLLKDLLVLDGIDKEGNEAYSADEDEEEEGEEEVPFGDDEDAEYGLDDDAEYGEDDDYDEEDESDSNAGGGPNKRQK